MCMQCNPVMKWTRIDQSIKKKKQLARLDQQDKSLLARFVGLKGTLHGLIFLRDMLNSLSLSHVAHPAVSCHIPTTSKEETPSPLPLIKVSKGEQQQQGRSRANWEQQKLRQQEDGMDRAEEFSKQEILHAYVYIYLYIYIEKNTQARNKIGETERETHAQLYI
jgi:hypothetical protein